MARTKGFDEEEVLQKAMQIFWSKGYNGTSMQDLVKGLGINRSSMYDTFTDKRSLYINALTHYRKSQTKVLIEVIGKSVSIKETMRQVLQSAITQTREECKKGCFMVNSTVELAPHDEEIQKIVLSNWQEVENALSKAIEQAQARKEINTKKEARALSRYFMNMFNGLRVTAKTGSEPKVLNDIVETSLAVFD